MRNHAITTRVTAESDLMSTDYKIVVDLTNILEATNQVINQQVLPLLNQAVRAVAEQTRANWTESVQRAKLWSGEKDAYAASIEMKMTGDFSAIIWSDYKYAEEIETGRPARDLKKYLDTSAKVRRTKDGRRFLVIPFRQNATGDALAQSMPPSVYEAARELTQSIVMGQRMRPSGEMTALHSKFGMKTLKRQDPFLSDIGAKSVYLVAARTYQWGGRLPASFGPRYAGMVRMQESSGGSQYLTFRVMREGSSGWIVPPKPGLFIARQVVEQMQPLAEKVFAEAIRRTLG